MSSNLNYLPTKRPGRYMSSSPWLAALIVALAAVILPQYLTADDEPFRQQRREVFEIIPVKDGDIVFLGNSITNFGLWPEIFATESRVVNRGISGIGSEETARHIDMIAKGHPSKLFLMTGINDYEKPEVVIPAIKEIKKVFDRESPQTDIYVQSILPCNVEARRPIVIPLNKRLEETCKELGLTFIDLYPILCDPDGTNSLNRGHTNDNLHLLASGYRRWSRFLQPYVGGKPLWTSDINTVVEGLSTLNNIRLSQYVNLPVNDGDVLMLGDYNVMTCEWQELLQQSRIKNRGFGQSWGYTLRIDDMAKVIPKVIKGNPSQVFVQCGMRDLDTEAAPVEELWEKYKSAIEVILSRTPSATIYIQSIIPSVYPGNNRNSIVPFNDKMKEYASSTDRVEFVDLYEALADPASDSLSEKYVGANTSQSHGVNGQAYLRWGSLIAPLIEGASDPQTRTNAQ